MLIMQLTINYHNYAFGDRTSYTPTFLVHVHAHMHISRTRTRPHFSAEVQSRSIELALKAGNADYAAAPLISIQPGTHMFP